MKRWMTKRYQADFGKIAGKYHISEILAELLVKRRLFDWESMNRFLVPKMEYLRDPFQMKDFENAVQRIEQAIKQGKKIKIVGDYDVDGVTSTYILLHGIELLGGTAHYRIPHRIADGYGIRDYMAEEAKEEGCDLVLTCDNGISAYQAVQRAKELGMEVIITDHHEVPLQDGEEIIPPADAVVDPKQKACPYPFKDLCGAGIAYKLMAALFARAGRGDAVEELLPFAAIATVCDVVPLFDENRILVKNGLELLDMPKNIGLRALVEAQELKRKLDVGDLGFRIGPCINAAGRLDDAKLGMELFLEENQALAAQKAEELVRLNEERKLYTSKATEQAVRMIEAAEFDQKAVYVILLEDCHESIAGIVAGRLREKYFHPAIVLTRTKWGLKGSGRSIPGYHMQKEINACGDLLTEFGGHAMAAGLSLPAENYEAFYRKLNENCSLTEEDFIEKISFDMEVPLGAVDESLVRQLSYLEPVGEGNPEIVFAARDLKIASLSLCGKENQVARVRFTEGVTTYQAVDFQCELHLGEAIRARYGVETWEKMKQGVIPDVSVDVLYRPALNERYGGIDYRILECR